MEELIPILIGVAWFAYKLYQGGQKKAKPQVRRPESQNREEQVSSSPVADMSLDDFMKNFFGTEQPKPQPAIVSDYQETVEEQYEATEEFKPYESIEQGYQPYKPPVSVSSIEHENYQSLHRDIEKRNNFFQETETTENEYNINHFDVKKAIIYDAILNRPYV